MRKYNKVWILEMWKRDLDQGHVDAIVSSLTEARNWLRGNVSDIADCLYTYARVYPVYLNSLAWPSAARVEWWEWHNGPSGYYNDGGFRPLKGPPPVEGRYTIGGSFA